MFKKANVVMLPTNEKAKVGMINFADFNRKGYQLELIHYITNGEGLKPQHLYIISDEEIKEGDWFISNPNTIVCSLTTIEKSEGITFNSNDSERIISKNGTRQQYLSRCRKIITSTDSSLNLPQPSQSFIQKYIEEYNKGNIITDVMVEYEEWYSAKMPIDFMDRLDLTQGMPIIDGTQTIELKIKINSKDNTVTIKKVKNSWTKEEVKQIAWEIFTNKSPKIPISLIESKLIPEFEILFNQILNK